MNKDYIYPTPVAWDEIRADSAPYDNTPIAYQLGRVIVNAAAITIGDVTLPEQLEIFTYDGDGTYTVYAVKHPVLGIGLFIALEIEG